MPMLLNMTVQQDSVLLYSLLLNMNVQQDSVLLYPN